MRNIFFQPDAENDLFDVPKIFRSKIAKKLDNMEKWPDERLFRKTLKGFKPLLYCVRLDDYRIIFHRKDNDIIINAIFHRKDNYKIIKKRFSS